MGFWVIGSTSWQRFCSLAKVWDMKVVSSVWRFSRVSASVARAWGWSGARASIAASFASCLCDGGGVRNEGGVRMEGEGREGGEGGESCTAWHEAGQGEEGGTEGGRVDQ